MKKFILVTLFTAFQIVAFSQLPLPKNVELNSVAVYKSTQYLKQATASFSYGQECAFFIDGFPYYLMSTKSTKTTFCFELEDDVKYRNMTNRTIFLNYKKIDENIHLFYNSTFKVYMIKK